MADQGDVDEDDSHDHESFGRLSRAYRMITGRRHLFCMRNCTDLYAKVCITHKQAITKYKSANSTHIFSCSIDLVSMVV